MEKKHKKVTFELPTEEYFYLKTICAKEGVSMKDFINESIKIYLEKSGNNELLKEFYNKKNNE